MDGRTEGGREGWTNKWTHGWMDRWKNGRTDGPTDPRDESDFIGHCPTNIECPTEIKQTEILMNKPVYVGLSMLQLSKILMYEFWYDYVKSKYGEKTKLYYMDTDSFIVYIITDDIYNILKLDLILMN